MAVLHFRTFLAINCNGDYTGVAHHFNVVDPAISDPWLLAEQLRQELEGSGASAGLFAPLQAALANDCEIQSLRVRQIYPTPGPTNVKVYGVGDYPGGFGGDVESNSVAGCSIWVTGAQLGLSGRTFWPGVSNDAISNGRFTAPYVVAIRDVIDYLKANIVGTSETWRMELRTRIGNIYNDVVEGYLSPTPGTMKRRVQPY